MDTKINEVEINGQVYVKKGSEKAMAQNTDGMKYVIVRGDRSGVFAGYLKEANGKEVTLLNSRRMWYWSGAASISQLAVDGVSKPTECKFPCEVSEMIVLDVIEIIPCTEKARLSIAGVRVWEN